MRRGIRRSLAKAFSSKRELLPDDPGETSEAQVDVDRNLSDADADVPDEDADVRDAADAAVARAVAEVVVQQQHNSLCDAAERVHDAPDVRRSRKTGSPDSESENKPPAGSRPVRSQRKAVKHLQVDPVELQAAIDAAAAAGVDATDLRQAQADMRRLLQLRRGTQEVAKTHAAPKHAKCAVPSSPAPNLTPAPVRASPAQSEPSPRSLSRQQLTARKKHRAAQQLQIALESICDSGNDLELTARLEAATESAIQARVEPSDIQVAQTELRRLRGDAAAKAQLVQVVPLAGADDCTAVLGLWIARLTCTVCGPQRIE